MRPATSAGSRPVTWRASTSTRPSVASSATGWLARGRTSTKAKSGPWCARWPAGPAPAALVAERGALALSTDRRRLARQVFQPSVHISMQCRWLSRRKPELAAGLPGARRPGPPRAEAGDGGEGVEHLAGEACRRIVFWWSVELVVGRGSGVDEDVDCFRTHCSFRSACGEGEAADGGQRGEPDAGP